MGDRSKPGRKHMIRKEIFLFVALLVAQTGLSQWASGWRVYRMADGLPESFCSSVTVALSGRVVVTHPHAQQITELDGYHVKAFPWTGPSAIRANESPGGQLWVLTSEGLSEWKDGTWTLHPVIEIKAALQRGYEVSILPVQPRRVLVLLPNRLIEFSTDGPTGDESKTLYSVDRTHIGIFTGMARVRDGDLWITGAEGLARVAKSSSGILGNQTWRESIPPASLTLTNFRAPEPDGESGVTCVAESVATGKKIAVYFDSQSWKSLSPDGGNLRFAWRWPDGTFGAASSDALLQWQEGRAFENDEISGRQYFDAAVGTNEAVWLATSDGLLRFAPLMWEAPLFAGNAASFVGAIARDTSGTLWFVSDGKLQSVLNGLHEEFLLPESADRNPRTALLAPVKEQLLIKLGERLFLFDIAAKKFRLLQLEGFQEIDLPGVLKDGSVCVQGISSGTVTLSIYDGERFRAFPFPKPDLSIGLRISCLLAAQNGDFWVGGERGVAYYHDQKWQNFVSTNGAAPEGVVDFAELPDGKIWCATPDKIWEFDGRNWTHIRSGFDRINELFRARDGSVWIASSGGLNHFWQQAWIENGVEDGLPSSSIRAVCEGQDGRIWAATARGLSVYHPEADQDPPRTRIRMLPGNEPKLIEGDTINLLFEGQDKWKYTSLARLLYSYRLDQHDWSAFQDLNTVLFPDLAAGKHYLQVRAVDRAGNIEPEPAQFEFAVAVPWYKETRIVWISVGALMVTLFFAGLAFNRHRQLLRSYAEVEKKVVERTRELEAANRELLHSQKMTALGTLAAGIAHDFNNILSIIKGSTQIIEDNLDNPQKVRTRLDRIKTVVEQGTGVIRAMLGFSRTPDEGRALCDVNELVKETIKLLGDRFLHDVEVIFEPATGLPPVRTAPDFVQQVLLNFIFNAAESMTERHKRIVLATQAGSRLPAGAVLMPAASTEYVSISVKDSGCGIPPENMPRIFEPFFTTKAFSTRHGTGLGLSMVYELANKMEAGLAVKSVVNEGSVFTLILPVREPSKTSNSGAAHTPYHEHRQ